MKRHHIGLAVLAAAALCMAVPAASAETPVSSYVVTAVCTVYTDQVDDVLALLLGSSLGESMPDCKIDVELKRADPAMATATVDIPVGSLFPECAPDNACFIPYEIAVASGTTVTWNNSDNVLHTVTGKEPHPDGNFDSWLLPGEEFSFTFETEGTYPYGCTVHPWAAGVVTVGSAPAAEPAPGMDAPDPVPEAEPEPMPGNQSWCSQYGWCPPPEAEPMPGTESEPEPAPAAELDPREAAAMELVDANIELYKREGTGAFATITAMAENPDPLVGGFVVDEVSYVLVAHTQSPQFVGFNVGPVLERASIPVDVLLAILERESGGVWMSYPVPDLQGNILGYDRGWFKSHDGYAFAGRFSVSEEDRVQGVVAEMTRLYDLDPDGAFATINSFMSQDANYPFVLDPNTTRIVAHGASAARVGDVSVVLTASSVPLETLRALEEGEGVWSEYVFFNPETEMESSPKRSWIVMHDGYLFGSGFYPEPSG